MTTLVPHPQWQWRWAHNGLIMPWFTKPCLDWLVQQDLRNRTVLEWGIGVDIPWWCANSRQFIGIEHDPGLGRDHQNIKPPPNAVLAYAGVTDQATEDGTDDSNVYVWSGIQMACGRRHPMGFRVDVFVIDGLYRRGCAHALIHTLHSDNLLCAEQGQRPTERIIIVDNAERPGLQPIREEFAHFGWQKTSYTQPDHSEGWTTDVWTA